MNIRKSLLLISLASFMSLSVSAAEINLKFESSNFAGEKVYEIQKNGLTILKKLPMGE